MTGLRLKRRGEEILRSAVAKQLTNWTVFEAKRREQVSSIEFYNIVKAMLLDSKLTEGGNLKPKSPPAVIGSLRVIEKVYVVVADTCFDAGVTEATVIWFAKNVNVSPDEMLSTPLSIPES